MKHERWSKEEIKKVSEAAMSIFMWVVAVDKF
jgi:hypothetical protein